MRLSVGVSVSLSGATFIHRGLHPDVHWGMVGVALGLCTVGQICSWITGSVAMMPNAAWLVVVVVEVVVVVIERCTVN